MSATPTTSKDLTISLIDARSTSLTVTWPEMDDANRYVLEYRKVVVTTTDDDDDDGEKTDNNKKFTLLSDKLTQTQTQAKKKNLEPSTSYYFRVRAGINKKEGDSTTAKKNWISHDDPITTLSIEDDEKSMDTPKVTHPGSNQTLLVSWSSSSTPSLSLYELQMRENIGGSQWNTIASSLSSTQVKKKNLISSNGYSFRVRPSSSATTPTNTSTSPINNNIPFSPPSDAVVARGLSIGIKQWFNSLEDGTLIRSRLGNTTTTQQQQPSVEKVVPLEDALGGKEFILLYASASWCPPCRQYTPMLSKFYNTCRNVVEIVFLSCDHDTKSFETYFHSHHPWMAIDYDDDGRENILGKINVSGIPRLVVLSGKTGKIIENNAVGQPLDIQRWRTLDK